jgi:sialic acid synthase SpsE/sugar phosphate isomerase/epimerase
MIIDKNIRKYIVFKEDSILQALEQISKNKKRIVFAVSENGVLEGIMTDGDFRRWISGQSNIDLNLPVSEVMNTSFQFCFEDTPKSESESFFSERIEYIPVLDQSKRLIAVLCNSKHEFEIDGYLISDSSPCFIIAEIGNNHNGDYGLAKKLVDLALKSGADCAKFQMRDISSLYRNTDSKEINGEDLGTEYTLDLLERFQLKDNELFNIFDYCRTKGIIPLCTPWDFSSLEKLEKYGMPAYKIASADLTNHDFLIGSAETGKPLICSTGMSKEYEIKLALDLFQKKGAVFSLLHCNSTYPAPFKDINLNYISRLKQLGSCPVGYSGHERGIFIPIAAVAKGAKIIEKHFTLDRNMEGNDHRVSLLPGEFTDMVRGIREVELSLDGSDRGKNITQGELINRENLAKSLVINQKLKKGDIITGSMIDVRSPGKGLEPYRRLELIGKKAKRDYAKGDYFFISDVENICIEPNKNYNFNRPWGIPVRFHDFHPLLGKSKFDFIEFHLSYKDLELNIDDYFQNTYDIEFFVHSPELFKNDHILDLCSRDKSYREKSMHEFKKVIALTRSLKKYFPKTKSPRIIVNVGGFSMNSPLEKDTTKELYKIFAQSFNELDLDGVEIIPQTMPPFPWHFGGQRFHNLFMDPDEIVEICRQLGIYICLDVSHSKLACNHFKWSFSEFLEKAGPFVDHIHIADAKGVDGEGLQVGEGEMDFRTLYHDLDKFSPQASFIPEIWQGHKNNGEGFWIALNRLMEYQD